MAVTEKDLPRITGREDEETVRYANELFEKARRQRLFFEQQWYTNIAFYFGRQYVQWTPGTLGQYARLNEPPAPPWRVRLVSNRIRPIVRTELSKVTKEKPMGFVVPNSNDEKDLLAAQAAEQIWEWVWLQKEMQKVIRRAEFWTLLCGTGFIKDWYDTNAIDASGKKGDFKMEPVSPFHLLVPDVQEEELEQQPYVIHYLAKSPEWVAATYGKQVTADTVARGGILEQRFLSAIGVQQNKTYVGVKEAWIKPNKKYPKGAVITWAGSTLLYQTKPEEGWPYEHNQFPFTKLDHIPTGRFYGDSSIVDLIPLQKEYNRGRSQILESKNRMSKPQLLAPRGSVDPNKMTSEPGLIIFYTPGFQAPTPLPLQSLPSYVLEELDRTLRDMDDISGQHEVSKGQAPTGVIAATAMSFLQEQDDTKLAITIANLEGGVERLGRHILSNVQQFWSAQRGISVMGQSGQYEAYTLSKSDVRGNTNFHVEAGSATPRSKAAKQAFITEIGKLGWIPPDKALRYLDMAETGKLYDELNVDSRQSQRENLKMTQGLEIEVNDWDNHDVHTVEHNNYRKTQGFEALEDDKKKIFEMHVGIHMAKVQALQQPPGGTMPGTPGPPQPEQPGGPPNMPPQPGA